MSVHEEQDLREPVASTVTAADGTPIAVWEWGSGAPVVAVHCAATDHTLWSGVAPLLDGHRVLGYDRRGYGASGTGGEYTPANETGDLTAVAATAATSGAAPVLLAHSSGALAALRAAVDAGPFAALVLYEPPLTQATDAADRPSQRMRAALADGDRDTAAALFLTDIVGLPAELVRTRRTAPDWPEFAAQAPAILHDTVLSERGAGTAESLRALDVPVLLLCGEQSPAAMRESMHELAALLPHAELRVLPGLGHWAPNTDPETLAAAILAWLRAPGPAA